MSESSNTPSPLSTARFTILFGTKPPIESNTATEISATDWWFTMNESALGHRMTLAAGSPVASAMGAAWATASSNGDFTAIPQLDVELFRAARLGVLPATPIIGLDTLSSVVVVTPTFPPSSTAICRLPLTGRIATAAVEEAPLESS